MQLSRMICAAMLAGATSVASLQGAAAAPPAVNAGIGKTASNVETVRYRHGHGWRHHGWRHHRGWRHGYYRNGPAVLGGLAAGAIVGSAIANSQARADTEAYCEQRFKSYDPVSGTYLGYDGYRHPCP